MFHRFRYEAKFYPNLNRLPLHVRMKLDLTGLKISLNDWLAYGREERQVLCHLPAESTEERQVFAAYLDFLSRKYQGKPVEVTEAMDSALWSAAQVPAPVAQKSSACSDAVNLEEWRAWQEHQRYALYKTAVSKNQPEAFAGVLDELRESDLLQPKVGP
jgi:hypothetical protein